MRDPAEKVGKNSPKKDFINPLTMSFIMVELHIEVNAKKEVQEMKVFTVSGTEVQEGVQVHTFALSCGKKIPAVIVGESGRGRREGIIPVELPEDEYIFWKEKENTFVYHVTLSVSRTGRPKFSSSSDVLTDKCVVILRTPIGYRGGNKHLGDWVTPPIDGELPPHHEFPCEILVEGIIAQGEAGKMGQGRQYVVIAKKDDVFSVHLTGRLYGAPSNIYYMFDGATLQCKTLQERIIKDF